MSDRRRISSGSPWEREVGYSRAVRVGDRVFVSGTTAVDDEGEIVGEGDLEAQTRHCFRRIVRALRRADARLSDVVRTRIYVVDIEAWREVARVHGALFARIRPAATMVEVSRLIDPRLLVEIEVEAVVAPRA